MFMFYIRVRVDVCVYSKCDESLNGRQVVSFFCVRVLNVGACVIIELYLSV